MRLKKFSVRNFKGISSLDIQWDDIIVLIGPNNCGKSSVLQALDQYLSGSAVRDASLFRDHQTDEPNAIELIGHFDQLSPTEQQQNAVTGRMLDGEWILKKRFWREEDAESPERSSWQEKYYSYSSAEMFVDWPQPDTTWAAFPQPYQDVMRQHWPDRPARPNVDARANLKTLVRAHRPDLVQVAPPDWIPNPGGGGNWKSNANSILPRSLYVRAVHDAADETESKDASSFGKIINLIIERRMMQRPEVQQLRANIEAVLRLFRPNPAQPESQAEEIRQVQARINEGLAQIIGGTAKINTTEPDIQSFLMPSTSLVIKDAASAIETSVLHQGHGLQRSLVMTLLNILADIETVPGAPPEAARAAILLVEEPELYMHPQMERKMRDTLYRLAAGVNFQVICTTHSPVFLDMGRKHKSIVRVLKTPQGQTCFQVTQELLAPGDPNEERDRMQLVARFDPAVNEVFFASKVVLFEEMTALVAVECGAELTGLFRRHPHVQRDVTFIDCRGKPNIPTFQRVLNHFRIPYVVIHDEDRGKAAAAVNAAIAALAAQVNGNVVHLVSPDDFETMMGYNATKDKPYRALKQVQALHQAQTLPPGFMAAMNTAYFGLAQEPSAA